MIKFRKYGTYKVWYRTDTFFETGKHFMPAKVYGEVADRGQNGTRHDGWCALVIGGLQKNLVEYGYNTREEAEAVVVAELAWRGVDFNNLAIEF